jgi:FkbM family methyltransferase
MNFDHYESEETKVIDLLSCGAKQILDIGANIGWHTIRFAKHNPNANIHAFEPMPVSYSYLSRNIAANNAGCQVTPYNYGLSDAGGRFEFFIAPASGTNASLLNVAEAADADRVIGLTLTLDQWCSNYSIKPDFIKCDVEGAELLVFRGGRETLMRDKPIVFAELLRKWSKPFGYHPNEMLRFFSGLGYLCFAVGVCGVRQITQVEDETIETNYAFVHEHAHLQSIEKLNAFR